MFNYVETAAEADATIREAGAPFVLVRLANTEYDTTTGTVDGGSRRWDGYAVRWDYTSRDVDGESVLATDTRFIVSTRTNSGESMEEPKDGDRVQFDGQWSTVISCRPVKPATTAVCFIVQTRT